MTQHLPDIVKRCNINAKGCHVTYNLTARAEEEISQQLKEMVKKPKYKKYYDACDNDACQAKERH